MIRNSTETGKVRNKKENTSLDRYFLYCFSHMNIQMEVKKKDKYMLFIKIKMEFIMKLDDMILNVIKFIIEKIF